MDDDIPKSVEEGTEAVLGTGTIDPEKTYTLPGKDLAKLGVIISQGTARTVLQGTSELATKFREEIYTMIQNDFQEEFKRLDKVLDEEKPNNGLQEQLSELEEKQKRLYYWIQKIWDMVNEEGSEVIE